MEWNLRNSIGFALILILFGVSGALAQQGRTIVVKDKDGKAVGNAEITMNCGVMDFTSYANAQGSLYIRRTAPVICSINVKHPDFYPFDGRIEFSNGEDDVFPVVLRRSLAGGLEITVTDRESNAPVVGADVTIDCGMDGWRRTTDASGMAVVNKLMTPGTCQIQARQSDYENDSSTLTVPYEAGRAVTASVKMTRKVHIKTVRVTVVESSDETKTIAEAHVSMTGSWASGSSGSTGPNGVAKIRLDRPGRFQVEVSRDNYYTAKTIFDLAPGAANEDLELTVALAKKKNQDIGSPVLIQVRGQRFDGSVVDLENAIVTPEGGEGKLTWTDGKTTIMLPGFVGDSIQIVATRDGYEPETKSFTVPRLSTLYGAPSLTFTLKEKKAVVTGVSLAIEVTDKSDGTPVPGASVSLTGIGNSTTDSEGIARFAIPGGSIKDKQYLRAIVTKPGYVEKWSDIGSDLLKPSEDQRYFLIQLVTQSPITGGSRWDETESGQYGVWTRRGDTDIWDARWGGVSAELTITISGNQVKVERRKSADGNDCNYVGTIEPDGVTVKGLYSCTRFANSIPWSAKINR